MSWSDISIKIYAKMWKEGELESLGRTVSEWRAQMCRNFRRPDNEERKLASLPQIPFLHLFAQIIRICYPDVNEEEYFAWCIENEFRHYNAQLAETEGLQVYWDYVYKELQPIRYGELATQPAGISKESTLSEFIEWKKRANAEAWRAGTEWSMEDGMEGLRLCLEKWEEEVGDIVANFETFDFGNANEAQRQAIAASDGPVLITAGPGTGKTYTLVQRAIYLINEKDVKPEQIMIATFTEKAAKELITRITNELAQRDIPLNINEMYIGTFHSICLRILQDNLEYTCLKKNYRLLEAFDQNYEVFQVLKDFEEIENFELAIPKKYLNSWGQWVGIGSWKRAQNICTLVERLSEELVDADAMAEDPDPQIAVSAEILKKYKSLIEDKNLLDFSTIQTECYRLLKENPEILQKLQEQIRYIMVDEYQDTNYIQEQIVFLLAGERQNICVVGDDDQGLYRFRGATIRNILEFPQKPEFGGQCKVISLTENYRSNSGIVDFYNQWMENPLEFNWEEGEKKYRHDKTIIPHNTSGPQSPTVIRISGRNISNEEDRWHIQILNFIRNLKDSGKLTDYNQIAFLFSSVKFGNAVPLAEFLEENGIHVYSPRSDMFFKREEIRLATGFLLWLFRGYAAELREEKTVRLETNRRVNFSYLPSGALFYYCECMEKAKEAGMAENTKELRSWIRKRQDMLQNLLESRDASTDYAFSGLLYQLFTFEPFRTILKTDLNTGVTDIRPVRNLGLFTQLITKFEQLHGINVLTGGEKLRGHIDRLFGTYLRLLYENGISEYEDDSEYAPSGCVSFLTVHQAKGLEFPIVIVGSLENTPRDKNYLDLLLDKIEAAKTEDRKNKYFHRDVFEPQEQTKYFDFWRLYYTAFSRAQDLLVLTGYENSRYNSEKKRYEKAPSKFFQGLYSELPQENDPAFHIREFEFKPVKDVNLKETFSFTSHISEYETCPLQYKFYRELEFSRIKKASMIYGTLVHQTIEDIHRAVLRREEDTITKENIAKWLHSNYVTLSQKEHQYLREGQEAAVLKQVLGYVDRQKDHWDLIQEAEVDVSYVREDYIIEGTIDLIRGENGTVELVDFKSEPLPDVTEEKERRRLEQYWRQLQIYAWLVERRRGENVSGMKLYYTGEKEKEPTISMPYTKEGIEETMAGFDETVHNILKKDFSQEAASKKTCDSCDFRFHCGKAELK